MRFWLLAAVPLVFLLEYLLPSRTTLVFLAACVAVVPLAAWLGDATEQLARRTSPSIGGLLNATFGNAAEFIIALIALKKGLGSLVKASLTGSIIGNLLLVLGAATLAGGLKYKTLSFNAGAARLRATMLTLAAIALIAPASYHLLAGSAAAPHENGLSLSISLVLLVSYCLGLWFALGTHRQFFAAPASPKPESGEPAWSLWAAISVLAASTVLIARISEVLAASVEDAARALHMNPVFIGVIVIGVVGNAAEHTTAIMSARKNQMDLAVEIAIGSSIQIALFVAPVLVIASYWIGTQPIDLVFTPAEVLAVVLAVWITGQIAGDGQSNWMEGVQLLAVYLVLAFVFYYMPERQRPGLGVTGP